MRSFIKIASKAIEKKVYTALCHIMCKTQVPQVRCPSDWLVMYVLEFGSLVLEQCYAGTTQKAMLITTDHL